MAEDDLEVSGELPHGGSPCPAAGPQLKESGIAGDSASAGAASSLWRWQRRFAASRPEEGTEMSVASVQSGASRMGKGWGDDNAEGPPSSHTDGDVSAALQVDDYHSLPSGREEMSVA